MGYKIQTFGKIRRARDMMKFAARRGIKSASFTGTVKLHGSNAGIRFERDSQRGVPQSRRQVLADGLGLAGFGVFANLPAVQAEMGRLAEAVLWAFPKHDAVTFYGEWCGGNVQKGVALNQLPKQWVVYDYTVTIGSQGEDTRHLPFGSRFSADLSAIGLRSIVEAPKAHVDVDFTDAESLRQFKAFVEDITFDWTAECPWGKINGVTGLGEGAVWTADGELYHHRDMRFKSKGEAFTGRNHKVRIKKDEGPIAAHMIEMTEFLQQVAHPRRLEQMVFEVTDGSPDDLEMRHIGAAIKWLLKDVRDEDAEALAIIMHKVGEKTVTRQLSTYAREHVQACLR